MIVHKLIPVFVLMLDLLLLGSALAAGRDGDRNRRLAYLILAFSVWSLGVAGLRWADEPAAAFAWERFLHVGVVAIPALFYHYVWALLGETTRRPSLIAGYVLAAGFILLIPSPAFMSGVRLTGWGYVPIPGPAYGSFLLYFLTFIVAGLYVLGRAHRGNGSTFRKNRVRLVMLGGSIGLLGGIVDFGRFLLEAEWLYPPGIPASAMFALALGVAIVRYRLMNVGVIARRVLLYALTWIVMAPVLLVTVDVLEGLWPGWFGILAPADTPVHAVLVLLGVLVLALPVMRALEERLNRLVFHRRRAIAHALVSLSKKVPESLDLHTLATAVTEGLVRGIPVTHAALHVPRGDETFGALSRTVHEAIEAPPDGELPPPVVTWLRATRKTVLVDDIAYQGTSYAPAPDVIAALEGRGVALVVPVFFAEELTAVLVVGEKLSGEVFDPDEIELLEILGGQVATALRNASLYDHVRAQMDELRTARDLYGEAREADRAKEQFLAMLAHELRNPLAPILHAAHVLEATAGADPQTRQLIGMVRRQGEQLARLVDDLLDVSRIKLGKIRLDLRPVDLDAFVTRCLETVRASGKGHGRELSARLSGERLVVRADPVRLEQIVWNLLDNALKYSPADTPVAVSVAREDDIAVVNVVDLGAGISPELLPRIFELFTQAEASAERASGGLGLGLALVRSLAEQHGGSVEARSAGPGQGSHFIVRLPLARGLAVPAEKPDAATVGAVRTILVVEDDADARESLRQLLQLLGHRVEATGDGEIAVATALESAPDVALINIGLPGIDGYEVARRLRASVVGSRIYLVAVTGFGQPDDRRRAFESGFDTHVVKPVTYAN
ncbi:MAG: ATP-binding protein, partial [Candidatus Rokuibacteriota bacterium]